MLERLCHTLACRYDKDEQIANINQLLLKLDNLFSFS